LIGRFSARKEAMLIGPIEEQRHLLYDDSAWTEDELRLLLARAAKANGWEEPGMEDYDRYDEERRKRCP
jgi:hypothetical protein